MHQSCTTHRQQNTALALALCRSLCSIHTVVEIIMINHKVHRKEANSCLEFHILHQVRGRLLQLHKLHQNCFQGMASSWSQPARLIKPWSRCPLQGVFLSKIWFTINYKNQKFKLPWQSYMSCQHLQIGLVPAKKWPEIRWLQIYKTVNASSFTNVDALPCLWWSDIRYCWAQ